MSFGGHGPLVNMNLSNFCRIKVAVPKWWTAMQWRGIMVKWLKWLGYGAEFRLKVISSRLSFAMRQLENSVNPAVNGYQRRGISCAQDTVGL